ncbi:MAG: glutathione S-transferase family protein [Parvibaculum sp.]|nr:glutathione S-transferase family protein [Parvibaculum sp.]
MSLILHMHPLSSYCMKVVTPFYEMGVAHEKALIDFGDEASAAAFRALAPMSHMPVLEDRARGQVLPESSVIIEYAQTHYAKSALMIPRDPELALATRLWDRFSDNFVMTPMQKIVTDNLRPEGSHDPFGVGSARTMLRNAYVQLDARVSDKTWATGEAFSLADCALAPALWYANKVEPLAAHKSLDAYLKRLIVRPSFARTLEEAEPYLKFFPA